MFSGNGRGSRLLLQAIKQQNSSSLTVEAVEMAPENTSTTADIEESNEILEWEQLGSESIVLATNDNIVPVTNDNISLKKIKVATPVESLNKHQELDFEESSGEEFFEDSGSEYEPPGNLRANESNTSDNESIQDFSTSATDGRQSEKRRSKGQANPKMWKRTKNADLRLHGKSYIGFKKNVDRKYCQIATKQERSIGIKCPGHTVKQGKGGPRQNFKCSEITEDQRKYIFTSFWNLASWDAKKEFVRGQVLPTVPKHRRDSAQTSKKKVTFRYFLIVSDIEEELLQETKVNKSVCKKMFLATLGIGEKTVQNWVCTPQEHEEVLKEETAHVKAIENFLTGLSKVESHYARKSTSKLYLEPVWDSYRHVYRVYQEKCGEENKTAASWTTFFKVFKKNNLDIWCPKKDQCNTCSLFKNGSETAENYQSHIDRKQQARDEKETDKSDKNILCYAVDLQAVLLAPRLNASANYYKTKLKVHNWTFFNMDTKQVICYVWNETDGGLESDVFSSIATKFLNKEIIAYNPSKIVIWSDGCSYQNRNVKLSNALLDLSIKYSITIQQKYLEVGHTQMEVDSVHSCIERKLGRRREVYLPSDYLHIISGARQSPSPYEAVALSFSDFNQFEATYYSSIRPGKKSGDPVVTDLCALQYTSEGVIQFKLKFSDEWKDLPHRQKRMVTDQVRPSLYNGPLPIEESKYNHLQELKELIPRDCRLFYENLIHN